MLKLLVRHKLKTEISQNVWVRVNRPRELRNYRHTNAAEAHQPRVLYNFMEMEGFASILLPDQFGFEDDNKQILGTSFLADALCLPACI